VSTESPPKFKMPQCDPFYFELVDQLGEMPCRTREPIKLRDHKRVAIAAVIQRSIQLHSLSDC
jgi:hypothetical protein